MMGLRQASPRTKAGMKWLEKAGIRKKGGQVAPKGLHCACAFYCGLSMVVCSSINFIISCFVLSVIIIIISFV